MYQQTVRSNVHVYLSLNAAVDHLLRVRRDYVMSKSAVTIITVSVWFGCRFNDLKQWFSTGLAWGLAINLGGPSSNQIKNGFNFSNEWGKKKIRSSGLEVVFKRTPHGVQMA